MGANAWKTHLTGASKAILKGLMMSVLFFYLKTEDDD